eukprot:3833914-Rhodomonas_salina.1
MLRIRRVRSSTRMLCAVLTERTRVCQGFFSSTRGQDAHCDPCPKGSYTNTVGSYAAATRCPVLRGGMLLPGRQLQVRQVRRVPLPGLFPPPHPPSPYFFFLEDSHFFVLREARGVKEVGWWRGWVR